MPARINTSGVVAVIFDFDDTLAPDSTSKLLRTRGIDVDRFWQVEAKTLVDQGYDPTQAFLRLFLDNVGPDKPLGELTNAGLREFGRTLDEDFYPGLPGLFDDLRTIVAGHSGLSIEFFIISGGLEDLIRGSEIVESHFRGVYGCLLAGETENGPLRYVRRAVTFTEKVRFLFEINKGVTQEEALENPYVVNKDIPEERRPVPFENMLVVGDGRTDIPCFSLVERMEGKAFGVLHGEASGKNTLVELVGAGKRRARSINAPLYGPNDDLGIILRTMVATTCSEILYRRTT